MALGSDKQISQRCGYLSLQMSWYAFLFLIFLCFSQIDNGLQLWSGSTHLTQNPPLAPQCSSSALCLS